MPTRLLSILLALCLVAASKAIAQDTIPSGDSLALKKGTVLRAAAYTSAYYATSLFVLGKTWYRDRAVVPFHFYDDNAAYLQVDKLGHAFGSYVYSYLGHRYLLRTGHTRKESLLFGASLGFVLQAPVEIMDGIHEGYGFSWGDMVANAAGSMFVVGQEMLFGGQEARQKFSYRESSYARHANGYLGRTALDRLVTDYNGHTYWVSVPVYRLWRDDRIPGWLSVAGGYGANGMYGEFANLSEHDGVPLPEVVRYRQFLLSLDVDWTRVETQSGLLKAVLSGLTFVKLPFPAVELNSMGEWRAYWIYF